jgi:formylglycine-generating enzyme required for sulfatase activity
MRATHFMTRWGVCLGLLIGCADGKEPPAVTAMVPIGQGLIEFDFGAGGVDEQCRAGEIKSFCSEDPKPPVIYPAWPIGISAFEIDEHEVTNVQYQHCVAHSVCTEPQFVNALGGGAYDKYYDDDDGRFAGYPVVNITLEQAKTYCSWVGKRLPTAFEWEAAARQFASSNNGAASRFMFGDSPSECTGKQIAMAGCNANLSAPQLAKDSVNSQDAFSDGAGNVLYGMVGNVSEWTTTQYAESMHCSGDITEFQRSSGLECQNAYEECASEDISEFQICSQPHSVCQDCREEGDVGASINPECFGMCVSQLNGTKWICKQHLERSSEPSGPAIGSGRIIRGGNYQTGSAAPQTPVAFDLCDARIGAHVGLQNDASQPRPTLGFRCARDL